MAGSDILIGTELASDLGVNVGDKLRLTTVSAAAAGAETTLTIAGIFDLGNKAANARSTFMALRTAQSLLGLPGGVTSLDVTARDVYTAERMTLRVPAASGVQADSWIKTNAELFTAIAAQSTSNSAIRFFVGLSVAFGIASVLALAGSVAGSALGAGMLTLWQRSARSADGPPLFALVLEPSLFVEALALATLTGLGAALAPSRRAARLDPVVAIRG